MPKEQLIKPAKNERVRSESTRAPITIMPKKKITFGSNDSLRPYTWTSADYANAPDGKTQEQRVKERINNAKKVTALMGYIPGPIGITSIAANSLMGLDDAQEAFRKGDNVNGTLNLMGAIPLEPKTFGLGKGPFLSKLKEGALNAWSANSTALDLTDNYGLEKKKFGGTLYTKYKNGSTIKKPKVVTPTPTSATTPKPTNAPVSLVPKAKEKIVGDNTVVPKVIPKEVLHANEIKFENRIEQENKNVPSIVKTMNLFNPITWAVSPEKNKNTIRERLATNIYPIGYGDRTKAFTGLIADKRDPKLDAKTKRLETRQNYLNKYLNKPYDSTEIRETSLRPTKSSSPNAVYYSSKHTEERFPSHIGGFSSYRNPDSGMDGDSGGDIPYNVPTTKGKVPKNLQELQAMLGSKVVNDNHGELGGFTRTAGEDEKGYYVSYNDKWDLNPFGHGKMAPDASAGAGHPFELYGRVYYDKKTGERIVDKQEKKMGGMLYKKYFGGGEFKNVAAGVGALGTGLIDAIDTPNEYGEQSSIGTIGKSTLSMAATGASIGGPIGAGIGGAVGLVSGLFSASAQEKAQRIRKSKLETDRVRNESNLSAARIAGDNSLVNGYAGAQLYKNGGKVIAPLTQMQAKGGTISSLSSNNSEVVGQTHNEGGVKIPELGAELEDKETTAGNYVFSKELGFSSLHKPIAKKIGIIEKKIQSPERVNALNLLRKQESNLALAQEQVRKNLGLQ